MWEMTDIAVSIKMSLRHERRGKLKLQEGHLCDVATHYDLLIEENNDPFRDPLVLQEHMDLWDGPLFLDLLELDETKTVLEIGVGTGRLAGKVSPLCSQLTGIDISSKTIARAKENLRHFTNIKLIHDDFRTHDFKDAFDVIYSSLTMMHFEDKQEVLMKVDSLLKGGGIFCLSIDKNQSDSLNMGTRSIKVFPDTAEKIAELVKATKLSVKDVHETANAYIIRCTKEHR